MKILDCTKTLFLSIRFFLVMKRCRMARFYEMIEAYDSCMLQALKSKDPDFTAQAAEVLRKRGINTELIPLYLALALGNNLGDKIGPIVINAIAEAISKCDTPEAKEALLKLVARHPECLRSKEERNKSEIPPRSCLGGQRRTGHIKTLAQIIAERG